MMMITMTVCQSLFYGNFRVTYKWLGERNQRHHGKQGFASMPKSQVRKIASMGGKASGKRRHEDSENEEEDDDNNNSKLTNKIFQILFNLRYRWYKRTLPWKTRIC